MRRVRSDSELSAKHRLIVVLLAATGLVESSRAQPAAASKDVPRMSASVDPAVADKPDLSGVWTVYTAPGEKRRSFTAPLDLPFTPEGKRRREEYVQLARGRTGTGDNPGAHCVTYGMPATMEQAGFYPLEFIQRSDQLTIIFEVLGETRRVYFGARGIPPEKRLPSRQGYSFGRFEGDTLIVETTDLVDGLDQFNRPHSDQARIVEKFNLRRDAAGTLVLSDVLTLTDPIYYTQPITVELKWTPLVDGHIMPFPCMEEAWSRLLDARRAQLEAGKPITAEMKDVIDIYE